MGRRSAWLVTVLLVLALALPAPGSDRLGRPSRTLRVCVQVVYWNEALVSRCAEARLPLKASADDAQRIRRAWLTRTGADHSYLFELRIVNLGKVPVTLPPLASTLVLVDAHGEDHAVCHYDPVLDRPLRPGQHHDGFVSFDRQRVPPSRLVLKTGLSPETSLRL